MWGFGFGVVIFVGVIIDGVLGRFDGGFFVGFWSWKEWNFWEVEIVIVRKLMNR